MGLLALAAALLASLLLAAVGLSGPEARPWFLGGAALLFLLALGRALFPFLSRWSDDRLAREIGEKSPEVGDSLLSAVQLHRDADRLASEYALSRELIELHVDATSARAGTIDPGALVDRPASWKLLGRGTGLFLAWGALALLFPHLREESRALIFGAGKQAPAVASATPGAAPRLGDVTVTYRFPDYTGKEPETFEGTDGNLKALRGTVAEVALRSDRAVKSAQIVLNGKDRLPLAIAGSTLSGEITLLDEGSWTVEAKGADGSAAGEGSARTITVEDDHPPMVQILWPVEEEQEVNELQDVDLTWGAEDDYGLRSVELVWENHPPKESDEPHGVKPGKPSSGRIPLASFPKEAPLRHGDKYRWGLASLGLEPGGYVEWWVEAVDNDTIAPGPNRGRSSHHRLYLLSSTQIHEKAIALQEELLKAMLALLADHLELDPKKVAVEKLSDEAERLEGRSKDVAGALDKISEQMLKDPLGDEQVYQQILKIRGDLTGISAAWSAQSLESVARHAADPGAGKRTAFAEAREEAIPLLEKDVLFLDKLIEKQRYDGARQELAKLAADQKDLKKLLAEYKKGGVKDAELAKALEAKLAELEKRMGEVAMKMASTLKSMPMDFDNSALQESKLDQIQKAIQEGRMDDAAALTEQMLNDLDQMVAQMDQAESQFNLDPETAKRLGDASKELSRLSEEQKRVAEETNKLREQIQKRQDESGQKVADFAKKELEKVKQLRADMDELDRQSVMDPTMRMPVRQNRMGLERDVAELEQGLKSGELGDALSAAEDAQAALKQLKDYAENTRNEYGDRGGATPGSVGAASRSEGKAREIQDDLERLRASFEQSASPEERQKLSQLSQSQAKLQARAQGLADELGQLSEKTPFLPAETGQSVQSAANSMGDAHDKLRGGNAAGAVPPERQAISQLGDAQAQMQGAGGGQRQSMGIPLAQRLGMAHNGRGQEGMNGLSNDRVEIPDGSQFRVPKEFREDILEAMKKPSPDGYKQLNQEYYERLIK